MIYDAVLNSLNERPSISVSSNELALTSTIYILYPSYYLSSSVCDFSLQLSDCLIILAAGVLLLLILASS